MIRCAYCRARVHVNGPCRTCQRNERAATRYVVDAIRTGRATVLETGEIVQRTDDPQPCLPGAEYVRDLEIPHPTLDLPTAPFELTPPTETTETQLKLTE